jgi:hypothetical protein
MLHLAPLDPDYTSPWPESAKVLGASIKDDTATIDLSAGSMSNLTNLGSAFETAAQQQLIWTVTAVAPTVQRVRLTVARKTPGSGHVDWSAPQRRAKHHDILVPVQISSPGHGAKVRRRLTVTGEATVFEASVSWAVVDVASRKVLDKGFVTASAGAPSRGTWKFTAQLPASAARRNVEIRAWEASAKDGRVTHLDSKVVTVADRRSVAWSQVHHVARGEGLPLATGGDHQPAVVVDVERVAGHRATAGELHPYLPADRRATAAVRRQQRCRLTARRAPLGVVRADRA